MNAPLLRHLKAEFGMNGKSTTHILKELSRELDKLDLRNNQLLYVLLEVHVLATPAGNAH